MTGKLLSLNSHSLLNRTMNKTMSECKKEFESKQKDLQYFKKIGGLFYYKSFDRDIVVFRGFLDKNLRAKIEVTDPSTGIMVFRACWSMFRWLFKRVLCNRPFDRDYGIQSSPIFFAEKEAEVVVTDPSTGIMVFREWTMQQFLWHFLLLVTDPSTGIMVFRDDLKNIWLRSHEREIVTDPSTGIMVFRERWSRAAQVENQPM